MHFENCRALVKADKQDKTVNILIAGPAAGRRRLLAVIRSDFDHLHRNFSFQPREMVPVSGHPDLVIPYQKLCVMEQKGKKSFDEVLGDEIIELDVQDLLNGVDLEGARRAEPVLGKAEPEILVFVSYSHKDDDLREQLGTHLKIFQRQGLIRLWHDRLITASQEWQDHIDENLERADIILLLVSADFIASDYCYDIEMQRALARHEANEARVIPIIIRDVKWQQAPFGKLQALPRDGKAITLWPDRDSAWRQVADGIENVIKELRKP